MILTGLKGVSQKETNAKFFKKASELRKILKSENAATSAGDKGAINIWKDDKGIIRCEAMKYCVSFCKEKYTNIDDAIKWAKVFLPIIN